jgi:hypothetical protein
VSKKHVFPGAYSLIIDPQGGVRFEAGVVTGPGLKVVMKNRPGARRIGHLSIQNAPTKSERVRKIGIRLRRKDDTTFSAGLAMRENAKELPIAPCHLGGREGNLLHEKVIHNSAGVVPESER